MVSGCFYPRSCPVKNSPATRRGWTFGQALQPDFGAGLVILLNAGASAGAPVRGFPLCRRASSSSAPHCGGSRRRPAGLLQLFFSPFASLCKAKLFGVIVLTRYLRAWARPETPFAPSGNGAGRSPPGVGKSAWSPSRRPGSVARWVGWGSSMVLANLLGLPRRRP